MWQHFTFFFHLQQENTLTWHIWNWKIENDLYFDVLFSIVTLFLAEHFHFPKIYNTFWTAEDNKE